MMNLFFKILSGYFLISLLESCDQLQPNNDEASELSHPLTIKGMQLGLDYQEQIKVGERNGLCSSDFNYGKCNYKLTESVYVMPHLYYNLFQDEKVLGQVKLVLFSPYNFPVVKDQNRNVIADYPSLTKAEVNYVILMYLNKYGVSENEEWKDGGVAEWTVGDMHIKLEYYTTLYANGYQINPQIKWAFEKDAYSTTVTYEYRDNVKHLLKDEATHESEPIGDNI